MMALIPTWLLWTLYIGMAVLVWTLPVKAGSITITVQPGGLTRSYTIPDAQVARLLAVMKARYGQLRIVCTPTVPPDPPCVDTFRDRTNAEVFQAWIGGWMQGTVDAVRADEREALRNAVPDPTPINPQ